EVGGGGFAFEIGVRGDHGLLDLAVLQAGHELVDAQIVRADPGHRVDRAADDMVETAVFAGALDGHDVLGLLDHADHRSVAARALAARAFGRSGHRAAEVDAPHSSPDATELRP